MALRELRRRLRDNPREESTADLARLARVDEADTVKKLDGGPTVLVFRVGAEPVRPGLDAGEEMADLEPERVSGFAALPWPKREPAPESQQVRYRPDGGA